MQLPRQIYFTLKRLLILWGLIFAFVIAIGILTYIVKYYAVFIPYLFCLLVFSYSVLMCYLYAKIDVDTEIRLQDEVIRKLSKSEYDDVSHFIFTSIKPKIFPYRLSLYNKKLK